MSQYSICRKRMKAWFDMMQQHNIQRKPGQAFYLADHILRMYEVFAPSMKLLYPNEIQKVEQVRKHALDQGFEPARAITTLFTSSPSHTHLSHGLSPPATIQEFFHQGKSIGQNTVDKLQQTSFLLEKELQALQSKPITNNDPSALFTPSRQRYQPQSTTRQYEPHSYQPQQQQQQISDPYIYAPPRNDIPLPANHISRDMMDIKKLEDEIANIHRAQAEIASRSWNTPTNNAEQEQIRLDALRGMYYDQHQSQGIQALSDYITNTRKLRVRQHLHDGDINHVAKQLGFSPSTLETMIQWFGVEQTIERLFISDLSWLWMIFYFFKFLALCICTYRKGMDFFYKVPYRFVANVFGLGTFFDYFNLGYDPQHFELHLYFFLVRSLLQYIEPQIITFFQSLLQHATGFMPTVDWIQDVISLIRRKDNQGIEAVPLLIMTGIEAISHMMASNRSKQNHSYEQKSLDPKPSPLLIDPHAPTSDIALPLQSLNDKALREFTHPLNDAGKHAKTMFEIGAQDKQFTEFATSALHQVGFHYLRFEQNSKLPKHTIQVSFDERASKITPPDIILDTSFETTRQGYSPATQIYLRSMPESIEWLKTLTNSGIEGAPNTVTLHPENQNMIRGLAQADPSHIKIIPGQDKSFFRIKNVHLHQLSPFAQHTIQNVANQGNNNGGIVGILAPPDKSIFLRTVREDAWKTVETNASLYAQSCDRLLNEFFKHLSQPVQALTIAIFQLMCRTLTKIHPMFRFICDKISQFLNWLGPWVSWIQSHLTTILQMTGLLATYDRTLGNLDEYISTNLQIHYGAVSINEYFLETFAKYKPTMLDSLTNNRVMQAYEELPMRVQAKQVYEIKKFARALALYKPNDPSILTKPQTTVNVKNDTIVLDTLKMLKIDPQQIKSISDTTRKALLESIQSFALAPHPEEFDPRLIEILRRFKVNDIKESRDLFLTLAPDIEQDLQQIKKYRDNPKEFNRDALPKPVYDFNTNIQQSEQFVRLARTFQLFFLNLPRENPPPDGGSPIHPPNPPNPPSPPPGPPSPPPGPPSPPPGPPPPAPPIPTPPIPTPPPTEPTPPIPTPPPTPPPTEPTPPIPTPPPTEPTPPIPTPPTGPTDVPNRPDKGPVYGPVIPPPPNPFGPPLLKLPHKPFEIELPHRPPISPVDIPKDIKLPFRYIDYLSPYWYMDIGLQLYDKVRLITFPFFINTFNTALGALESARQLNEQLNENINNFVAPKKYDDWGREIPYTADDWMKSLVKSVQTLTFAYIGASFIVAVGTQAAAGGLAELVPTVINTVTTTLGKQAVKTMGAQGVKMVLGNVAGTNIMNPVVDAAAEVLIDIPFDYSGTTQNAYDFYNSPQGAGIKAQVNHFLSHSGHNTDYYAKHPQAFAQQFSTYLAQPSY